jgi:hypothetical protein
MLKATNTNNAIERFVFEAQIFGEAVDVLRSRSVQPLRGTKGLRIGLQPIRGLKMAGESFRPETVTATNVEQCAAG